MNRGLALVLVAAAVFAAGWLVLTGDDGGDVRVDAADRAAPTPESPRAPEPAPGESTDEREPVPEAVVVVGGGDEPAPAPHDHSPRAADLSWGRVVDPFGEPVQDVMVHAFIPGFRGIGGKVVAEVTTDRNGSFSFGIPAQLDPVRIDFVKEGYARERRSGSLRDMHVVLEPLRASRIEGRLVSPSGAALTALELSFLFGDAGSDQPPPFLDPSAVVAAPDRSLGQPEVQREASVAGDASFEVTQPLFFTGEVVLLFRGIVLARHPWQDGDPPVVFEVDVPALRRALGGVVVTVEGAGAEAAPDEPVDVDLIRRSPLTGRPETESFEVAPPGPLSIEGLTAGRYRLVVRRGAAVGLGEAVVPAGGTGRATVALAGPARVRVALRWIDGEPMQASEVHVVHRDADGVAHDIDQQASSVTGSVVVAIEAPAGAGVLVLDGNVLPVELAPGPNADLDWGIRRSRMVRLRAAVTTPSRADRPRLAAYRVSLRTLAGELAVHESGSVPIESDGYATIAVHAAPGRYRIALDFGELRKIEAGLVVSTEEGREEVYPPE